MLRRSDYDLVLCIRLSHSYEMYSPCLKCNASLNRKGFAVGPIGRWKVLYRPRP